MILLTIAAFIIGGYCFTLWAEHKAAKDKRKVKWPRSWERSNDDDSIWGM